MNSTVGRIPFYITGKDWQEIMAGNWVRLENPYGGGAIVIGLEDSMTNTQHRTLDRKQRQV